MSPLWHLMFWVILPVVLYITIRAYDEARR